MPPNYDELADAYAGNRSASRSVINELFRQGNVGKDSQLLEVGCGTADYIAALVGESGCRGWGVEPSSGMRAHAPTLDRLQLIAGTAEAMPIGDGAFDFMFTVNVVHHMVDPAAYFREAKRVLRAGGAICTVTESSEMIRRRNPLAMYWPAIVEPEIARYPTVEWLLANMQTAGFNEAAVHEISQPVVVTDSRPYRQRAFSSLLLISDAEFAAGLRQLEADLQNGPVEGVSEYVCLWANAS